MKIDGKATASADRLIADVRARWLDSALSSVANDQGVVAEIRRASEGEASAIGAAALALAAVPERDGKLSAFVDAWILRHGIAFAAITAVKIGDVGVRPDGAVQLNMNGGGHRTTALTMLLRRMRTVLATCSADEYAEVVAVLGDVRTCCEGCGAASAYLVPTETEWVAESCREYHFRRNEADFQRLNLLYRSLSTAKQVELLGECAVLDSYRPEMDVWVTLVDGLGPAAVPLLAALLEPRTPAVVVRAAGSVLAQIPGDDAFRLLAERALTDRRLGAAGLEASARFPERALRVLADVTAGGVDDTGAAHTLLRGHVRRHRELADAAAERLAEPGRTVVLEVLRQEPVMAAASKDRMPELLVSPPWSRVAVAGAAKIVGGLTAPELRQIVWGDEERAALASMDVEGSPRWDYGRMAANVARWVESGQFEYNGHDVAVNLFRSGPVVDETRELLRRWRPEVEWNIAFSFLPVLDRFGVDAIPALVHVARRTGPVESEGLLVPILDLEAARLAAGWLIHANDDDRQAAEAWFARHGSDAVVLLIPDALGRPGKARAAAEGALRHLAGTTAVPDLVDITAAEYGADAADAVRAVLEARTGESDEHAEHVEHGDAVPPALPGWLDPAALPQVLLRGGESALPEGATRNLLSILALSASQESYSSALSAVMDMFDEASFAAFVRNVVDAWRAAGRPARQSWIESASKRVPDAPYAIGY